jgi:signal transduction histidine kinase/CheY-like chemotaxis protein
VRIPPSLRRVRLGTILALLLLVTLVPLGLFAGWLVYNSWLQQQAVVNEQNVQRARAASVAIDQEVQSTIAALNALAILVPIDPLDLKPFHDAAASMLEVNRGWQAVRLVEPNANVVVNTAVPFGQPSKLVSDDWVRTVRSSKRPTVSAAARDPETGQLFISVAVPVIREGQLWYILSARIPTSEFSDILKRQQAPPDGVLALLDSDLTLIARTRSEDLYLGRKPTEDFIVALKSAPEGARRSRLLEGVPSFSSWSKSPLTGWTLALGLPAATVDGPILRSLLMLVTVGVSILGAGLILTIIVRWRIVRALVAAVAASRGVARGAPLPEWTSRITEFSDLADGLQDAATILDRRLAERDDAEQKRERVAGDLERALTREHSARRTAEMMSRAKDEFVATVSHELRTPLNAIFGWVAMMKMGALDAAGQAKALDVIDRNTRMQAQLIEDLLDMARVIRGTVRLEMHPIDLADVIESAADAVKPAADARKITIRIDARAGLATVSGDSARLQQVIWNLLSNSIKFSKAGAAVQITLKRDENDAEVSVEDTGAGIDPAFLPHVFDRFRQERSDVTREHSGLGLGLSLARHLVELHGGTVTAASGGKDRGSIFTVRLPLLGGAEQQKTSAERQLQSSEVPPNALQHLNILEVDDDVDARDLVAAVLRRAGAEVTTAASVQEALGLLEARTPDVVVTDIAMPHATGFDLVRHLRSDARWCEIPVIALTAYARAEDRAQALQLGFTAHLGKPFAPRALVALVAEVGRK